MSEQQIPENNSHWIHRRNGALYTVVTVSNKKSILKDFPITVVYKDRQDNTWSMPLEDWHVNMFENSGFRKVMSAYQAMQHLLMEKENFKHLNPNFVEERRSFEFNSREDVIWVIKAPTEYLRQSAGGNSIYAISERIYYVTAPALYSLLDFFVRLRTAVCDKLPQSSLVLQMDNDKKFNFFKIIFTGSNEIERNEYNLIYKEIIKDGLK